MASDELQASAVPSREGRLRNDVLITYGGKVAALVLGLVSSVVLARALGPSSRGLLAVAFSYAQILAQLGTLGLTVAKPYYASTGRASVDRLASTALWLSALVGIPLMVLGVVIRAAFPEVVSGLDWQSVSIAVAMVPAILAAALLQSLLVAEGRMMAYSFVEVIHGALTLGALIFGFEVLGFGATGALWIMAASTYAVVAVFAFLLRHHGSIRRPPDIPLMRGLLRYGFRIYVATVVAFLVIRLDVLLINALLDSADAGIYTVAVALADGMYLLPSVIGLNVFARIARGGSDAITAEVFRVISVLFAGVCGLSALVARPLIDGLYGPDFSGAVSLYYWLVPGIYALGMLSILSFHYAGKGYPRAAMVAWVLGLALNIAINLAFLSRGVYVASIASSAAYVLVLALHIRLFAREQGGLLALRPRLGEVRQFVQTAVRR